MAFVMLRSLHWGVSASREGVIQIPMRIGDATVTGMGCAKTCPVFIGKPGRPAAICAGEASGGRGSIAGFHRSLMREVSEGRGSIGETTGLGIGPPVFV